MKSAISMDNLFGRFTIRAYPLCKELERFGKNGSLSGQWTRCTGLHRMFSNTESSQILNVAHRTQLRAAKKVVEDMKLRDVLNAR